MQKGISHWGAAFIAVAVGAIAITGQSLWIDEGAAAFKAIQPSLGEWWQALREAAARISRCLSIFSMPGCGKKSSEAPNLPYALPITTADLGFCCARLGAESTAAVAILAHRAGGDQRFHLVLHE